MTPPISGDVPSGRRVAQTARISTGGLPPRVLTPKSAVEFRYHLRKRDRPVRTLPERKHPSTPIREPEQNHQAAILCVTQVPACIPPPLVFRPVPPRPSAAASYNPGGHPIPATQSGTFVERAPPIPPSETIRKVSVPTMTPEERANFNRTLSLRLAYEEYLQSQAGKKPRYQPLFSKLITKKRDWQPGQPRGKVSFFTPKTPRALEHERLLALYDFKSVQQSFILR